MTANPQGLPKPLSEMGPVPPWADPLHVHAGSGLRAHTPRAAYKVTPGLAPAPATGPVFRRLQPCEPPATPLARYGACAGARFASGSANAPHKPP